MRALRRPARCIGRARRCATNEARLTAPDTPRSWTATCVGLVLLAAAVRSATFAVAPPTAWVGDEIYYAEVARSIARGEGHVFRDPYGATLRAWRPPGQAAVLAAGLDPDRARSADPSVTGLLPLVWIQIALGSLLAAAAATLGAALLDRRTGTLAGLAVAFHPTLVFFSHTLWSETLSALLITTALAIAASRHGVPGIGRAALAGVLLGGATLVREVALLVAAVCAAWWAWQATGDARRVALASGAVVLGVALLCVAPWTARNAAVLGRFIPVSTIGWFAASEGNVFEPGDWLRDTGPAHLAFSQQYFALGDEMARSDFARGFAIAAIRDEQPSWLLRKAIRNGALLLSPDSYLLFKQSVGAYGEISPIARVTSVVAVGLVWVVSALLAALGLAAATPAIRRLAISVLAVPATVHLLTNATSRFRVPWLGLWLVLAAFGALSLPGWRAHWGRLSLPARIGLCGFAGFVLAVAVPYFAVYGGRR
jgi:hypothetical protein